MNLRLLSVQQLRGLRHIGHVGRGDDHRMYQLAVPIRSNVRFHSEIPLVTPLGLVHFRIAFFLLVLGR